MVQSNAPVSRGVRLSLTMKHNKPAWYVRYSVLAIAKNAENGRLRRKNVLVAEKLH